MLLKKQEIKQYCTDKLKVYSVNGEFVRNTYMPDFVGGHALIMDFIPSGEIWIADDLKENEVKRLVYFLLVEKKYMVKGLVYEDALRRANQAVSKNKVNLDRCIQDELGYTRYIIAEPSFSNGASHNLIHGHGDKYHTHFKKLHNNQRKLRKQIKDTPIIQKVS
jgi:hypothetical protein